MRTSLRMVGALAVLVGSPLAATGQTQSERVPITVISTSASAGKVTFLLRNDGRKPITAWQVRIQSSTPSEQTAGYGVDAYRAYAGLTSRSNLSITPGAIVTATAQLSNGADDALIVPIAAVFADKTFAGDRTEAEIVFQRRREQRLAWAAVVAELETASRAPTIGLATLQDAVARIDAVQAPESASSIPRLVRTNLTISAGDVQLGRATAPARLASILQHARRNLAVATQHSK
jgi:hypothetical protein